MLQVVVGRRRLFVLDLKFYVKVYNCSQRKLLNIDCVNKKVFSDIREEFFGVYG